VPSKLGNTLEVGLMKERDKVRAEQWAKTIQEWTKSGKSASSWCREQSLSYATFNYWKKRFLSNQSKNQPVHKPCKELPEGWSIPDWLQMNFRGGKLSLAKDYDRTALLMCLRLFEES